MDGLPKVGAKVEFDDRWFYPGRGIVVDTRSAPHEAVLVSITEIHYNGSHFLGRECWILAGYIEELSD